MIYLRFIVALFAILTPFAAIPIFLTLTEGAGHAYRVRTARNAAITVFCVLLVAALAGETLLEVVGASLPSFRVGGGIILLLMSVSMLSAKVSEVQQTAEEHEEARARDEVGVVPIGIPLLAGPGAISSVVIEMERAARWPEKLAVILSIAAVCAILWASLRLALPIGQRLGKTGLNILNRLFGLLLAAIAVEIIASGLKALFPLLDHV